MEPFSVDLWHSFEKAAQNYVDTSTHEATASSHTYETLFDNGEWKLFVPHSFEDDSHLAGGLEEFRCKNAHGEESVTTKAQWCTASNESYFKKYSTNGNRFYIAKHYLTNGKCDEAFQIAFCKETHVEIKDKFDMDLWIDQKDEINETHLSYLFDKAPKELLAKIVNDNPNCEIKNSLLDYVKMSHLLSDKYENIDDIIFYDKKDVEEYVKNGKVYIIREDNDVPKFVNHVRIYCNGEYSKGRSIFQRNIEIIELLGNVTSIGRGAFSYCIGLTSIVIPDSVTSIGDEAFRYCSSLTSIDIPDSVTSIGYRAFNDCSSLTSITIPDSVTSIGGWAFASCSKLTSINIPDSVTSISAYTFDVCSKLTSINIPDSVTYIGDSAFSYCKDLTSIDIPDSVTSIGYAAFASCTSLTRVNIPDSVTSISDNAFEGCDLVIYTNSEDVKNAFKDTFTVLPLSQANLNESTFSGIAYEAQRLGKYVKSITG